MAEVQRVSYLNKDEKIVVERLWRTTDISREHAMGVLALMAAAYGHQFEKPHGKAPQGTFARWFDAEDDHRVEAQLERMGEYIEKHESQYWLVHNGDPMSIGVHGLSKVSPSRAAWTQKTRLEAPDCYINDIVVMPRVQKRGLGSTLMHAPLTYGGYEPDKGVVLDAYRGNEQVNSWFERLGLVPVDVQKSVMYGGYTMDQILYSTTPFVSLGDVVKRLEASHPALKTSTPDMA